MALSDKKVLMVVPTQGFQHSPAEFMSNAA